MKCWVAVNVLLVIGERWVAVKLFGNVTMTVEKLIELRKCARVLPLLITIFLPHEVVGVFFYLFAYGGVFLQKGLQVGMRLQVIALVHQRRIAAKRLVYVLVVVQE